MRKFLLTSALCLLALPAVARENHALLIAAADYDNLEQKWWLNGPKNDAVLVETYLTTEAPVPFAAGNVTVLADAPGHDRATLDNIRKAFADLAATVQPGDFVYLHFSGHGTQAPAANPETELDGLDEMFLPVDIGKWGDKVGHVENALVDDEIGQMIDAIRAKGADVWVVFDSCHSGTATRAVETDEDVKVRQLDPSVLGIPEFEAMEDVVTRGVGEDPRAEGEAPMDAADAAASDGTPGMGSLVAFYAAQTTEVTPEKKLPKGDPQRKPQGVFTYTLFETLAEYPAATYGQIAQEVLRKYSVKNLAKATPLFEGDLDAAVFGASETAGRVAQWEALIEGTSFTIAAGTLHGLQEGDELAVMATAADTTDKALGYVKIVKADTFTATAEPVARDGKALPADLPKGLFLRKLDSSVDFGLTVALPPAGSAPADALLAALDSLQEAAGPRLNFVAAGAEADLALAVLPDSSRPDAIWVLPGTGLMEDPATTPSVGTEGKAPEEVAQTLADTLERMAKALNLMKLGDAIGAGGLDVEVEMQTRNDDDPKLRALPATPVPTLLPDDEVHVLARNNMDVPVDVNVLYIGADFSITHWFSGRLQPGDELKKPLFAIGDTELGDERMIVVITPADKHSKVEDLSYLTQDALEMTREVREVGGNSLEEVLENAGFGETTRGAVPLSDPGADDGPGPMILQIEVKTRAVN